MVRVTLRDVGLHDGVEEPAAAFDDAVLLLLHTGQEAGGVDHENQRHVEGVANRTNRAALSEASLSMAPDMCIGWFATTPTGRPSTRAKPVMMACPALGGDVEEVAVVEDPDRDLVHVVGGVVGVGTSCREFEIVRRDLRFEARVDYRGVVKVLGGRELGEVADVLECGVLESTTWWMLP